MSDFEPVSIKGELAELFGHGSTNYPLSMGRQVATLFGVVAVGVGILLPIALKVGPMPHQPAALNCAPTLPAPKP